MFAEGTRVADKLLIIDLPRPPTPLHLLRLATMLPLAPFVPFVHDGVISSLRCYSPSALRALAATPTRRSTVELRGGLAESAGRGGQPRDAGLGPFGGRRGHADRHSARAQRREYRRKVQLCLDVFETMLAQSSFDVRPPADRHGDRVQPGRRRRTSRR